MIIKKIDSFFLKQAQHLSDVVGERFGISHLRLGTYFVVSALVIEVIIALVICVPFPERFPFVTIFVIILGLVTLYRTTTFEELKGFCHNEEHLARVRESMDSKRITTLMTVRNLVIVSGSLYYCYPEAFRDLPLVLGSLMFITDVVVSGVGYYMASCKPPIAEEN